MNIWTPLFKSAQESGLAPEFLIHWGHAGAMATVLLAMGGYGTFLGWSTRLGNGSAVYPLSLGQTAAQLHPQLMGLALFLFFLGGQGGDGMKITCLVTVNHHPDGINMEDFED